MTIRVQEATWHCGMCGLRFTAQPAVDHVCARCGGIVEAPESVYGWDAVRRLGLGDAA